MKQYIFVFAGIICSGGLLSVAGNNPNCSIRSTYKAAEKCCHLHGKGLPSLISLKDIGAVIEEMTSKRMVSIWLSLTRKTEEEWSWVNGTKYHRMPLTSVNSSCAFYKTRGISPSPCRNNTDGYLCEKQACASCGAISDNYHHCIHLSGTCYLLICDAHNWLNARSRCLQKGMDLAVLDTSRKIQAIGEGTSDCPKIWIGLSRASWTTTDGSQSATRGLWADNEPSNRGNCVVYRMKGREYLMYAADCFEEHDTLCFGHLFHPNDPLSVTRGQSIEESTLVNVEKQGFPLRTYLPWILLAATLLLLFVILTLGFVFWGRRQHRHDEVHSEAKEPLLDRLKLRKKIAHEILSRYQKVRMWSWEEESLALPLDEIYVDLSVEKLDPLMSPRKALGNLEQLFLGGKNTRIYLYGEAGAGKTTLTQHLICSWSRLVLRAQPKETVQEPGVGKFQYVVPLFLRNVNEGSLHEAIREQLGLDSQETDLLLGNPQNILFVCEGYDEFNDTRCLDIARLVSADIFPDSSLLVTSRGQISLSVEKENVLPDYIVQLKGFTNDGVKAYINKFFYKIENPDTSALLIEIDESDYLKGLSNYPALLLLMCILWREGKMLAANVTEFFKDFISYTCMRYERKIRHPRDQTSKEQVLNMFKSELLNIGEIAVDGLKKDKMQLVFALNEVKQRIGESAWKLGLFKQNEEKRWTVSFHHGLLQEYFAAFFIVHCSNETRTKLLMEFYKSPNPLKESTMFTKFITGFGRTDIVLQISNIIGNGGEQSPRILTDFHLQYITECPGATFQLPSHVELGIEKTSEDTVKRYLSLDGTGLFNFIIEINQVGDLSVLRHLEAPHLEVLSVVITGSGKYDAKGSTRPLSNILPRYGILHTLRCKTAIPFDNCPEEPINAMMKDLHKLVELRILDLTGTCLGKASITTIAYALNTLPGLQQLILERCGINGDIYMESIVRALGNLKALTFINLAKNAAGIGSFRKLAEFLENTDTLQKLTLWDQESMDTDDVSLLFKGLSKHRQLECLDMRGIVCHFSEMGGMPQLFNSCVNLNMFQVYGLELNMGSARKQTSFIMKDVEVDEKDMESISKFVLPIKQLKDFVICNCNCSEASGWIALFKNLEALTELRSLSLDRMNVDAYALKRLHSAVRGLLISGIAIVDIQQRPEQKLQPIIEGLKEYKLLGLLNLSKNTLSDNDIYMLANALPELNVLATLILFKCCITDKPCTKLLIQSFGKCRSMQSLNLEGNNLRDRMIKQISAEIPGMCKIQSISLSDCGLIGLGSAECLLEVLSLYQNIQSLDLSGNFIGDDRSALYQLENLAREKGVGARIHIYRKADIEQVYRL